MSDDDVPSIPDDSSNNTNSVPSIPSDSESSNNNIINNDNNNRNEPELIVPLKGINVDNHENDELKEEQQIIIDSNETDIKLEQLSIGDMVLLTENREGIIQYIGKINLGKKDDTIWIGVELSEPNGKFDGKINGIRYFKTKKNCACFIKITKIVKVFKQIKSPSKSLRDQRKSYNKRKELLRKRNRMSRSPQNEADILGLIHQLGHESFNEIMKLELQNLLYSQCIDLVKHSQPYLPELDDSEVYNAYIEQLKKFCDGLFELTDIKIDINEDTDISEEFLLKKLPRKIVKIDGDRFGHYVWYLSLSFIRYLQTAIGDKVWLPSIYVAGIMPSAIAIRVYVELSNSLTRFPPHYIDRIGQRIVDKSVFTITICLKIAEFMKQLSENVSAYVTEYEMLYERYTNQAINIVNAITDDHAALIVLEAENDLEPAPQYGLDALTVAVRNDNGKFLSNERIFSILNAIWVARSYSATTKKGSKRKIVANYDDLNLLKMLKYHYPFMPQIPYGKYSIQLVFSLVYVVLLSYFSVFRLKIDTPKLRFSEVMLWIFGLAEGISSMYTTIFGSRLFGLEFSQIINSFIGINFLVLFLGRAYYVIVLGLENDPTENLVNHESYSLTFATLLTLTTIFVYIRSILLFSMDRRLGSLLIIITKLMTDVKNFSILFGLFFAGFSFAMFYYIGEDIDDYKGFAINVLNIFGHATTGEIDWNNISTSNSARTGISRVIFLILILFMAIVLLNLFIALMTNTFEQYYQRSGMEWSVAAAKIIITYDRRSDLIPPPVNIIVFLLYILYELIEFIGFGLFNRLPRDVINMDNNTFTFSDKMSIMLFGDDSTWYCSYCHSFQPNFDRIITTKHMLKWMESSGLQRKDQLEVLRTKALLCYRCKRVKRSQPRYEWILDKISYWCAYFTVLPILFAFAIPGGIFRFVSKRVSEIENNSEHEFYELIKQRRIDAKLYNEQVRLSKINDQNIQK